MCSVHIIVIIYIIFSTKFLSYLGLYKKWTLSIKKEWPYAPLSQIAGYTTESRWCFFGRKIPHDGESDAIDCWAVIHCDMEWHGVIWRARCHLQAAVSSAGWQNDRKECSISVDRMQQAWLWSCKKRPRCQVCSWEGTVSSSSLSVLSNISSPRPWLTLMSTENGRLWTARVCSVTK